MAALQIGQRTLKPAFFIDRPFSLLTMRPQRLQKSETSGIGWVNSRILGRASSEQMFLHFRHVRWRIGRFLLWQIQHCRSNAGIFSAGVQGNVKLPFSKRRCAMSLGLMSFLVLGNAARTYRCLRFSAAACLVFSFFSSSSFFVSTTGIDCVDITPGKFRHSSPLPPRRRGAKKRCPLHEFSVLSPDTRSRT